MNSFTRAMKIANRLAPRWLPAGCNVVAAQLESQFRGKRFVRVHFTYPGCPEGETGLWRSDRPDMVMLPQEGYVAWQRLKEPMTKKPTKAYLDTRELAERWGMTTGALRQMRLRGTGPRYFKPGGKNGKVRYAMDDVVMHEQNNRHGGDNA